MIASGIIKGINGPVLNVTTRGNSGMFKMSEMVMVGEKRLVGEVIGIRSGSVVVQVFEDTAGLTPGQTVNGTGRPLSLTLGPGIIGNIFDGIQRPLSAIAKNSGLYVASGVHVDNLDTGKKWPVRVLARPGDVLEEGAVFAEVNETPAVVFKAMVPPGVSGKVRRSVSSGQHTIGETICVLETDSGAAYELKLSQRWPIRAPRPVKERRSVSRPLITGQRIIDTLFPVAKGGMAAIPGGFGTGKTMTQHQLAKWSDADIIVYIGCGERGNEMTEVLEDFSKLTDPRTQQLMMARTVLIANTSNMPVAAREASIYTGITIAEFYRDMGYHVAVMADSTSRWAEALRELSGRLEEMPAEEGYPAYLASRLSGFYERAGYVESLNGSEGSITVVGAVSPQGADFSEPVTQNTKRFVRSFWGLDRTLAYARHFPAIHWIDSYSEYLEDMTDWYNENVGPDFTGRRLQILRILFEESELMEIVKLIGADVLPDSQRLTLAIARVIRLGFLQQNAYHAFDAYVPFSKQLKMMEIILYLHEACKKLLSFNISMNALTDEDIFEQVIQIKYNVGNDEPEKLETYFGKIDGFYETVYQQHG
ncbi:MAG: V-type ATP synthase subunit A [Clostridiales bacterium]|jgi:V/A-type H+-transporting ATPase subunit A|nr:V-type ATP synthase subunit A [Clostridiales bacterium]